MNKIKERIESLKLRENLEVGSILYNRGWEDFAEVINIRECERWKEPGAGVDFFMKNCSTCARCHVDIRLKDSDSFRTYSWCLHSQDFSKEEERK